MLRSGSSLGRGGGGSSGFQTAKTMKVYMLNSIADWKRYILQELATVYPRVCLLSTQRTSYSGAHGLATG
jgi:hypothetical protein